MQVTQAFYRIAAYMLLLILLTPIAAFFAAPVLAVRNRGWKRRLAWTCFALMSLALLVGGAGGILLGRKGLAWRSCVKLPLGMLYVFGVLAVLVLGGILLWGRAASTQWKPVMRVLYRCAAAAGTGFFVLAAGWYCLLFTAVWAGSDQEVAADGQTLVAEQTWMDWDCYAYYNSFLRGSEPLYMDPEVEQRLADPASTSAAARKKAAQTLGLDLPEGEVEFSTDTHGGFLGDGKTYIQIRFTDGRALLEQLKASLDWTALPLPEDLAALSALVRSDGIPPVPAVENGWYWFQDRQAADSRDYSETLDRCSYNFTLAVYDADDRRLYYWELDT